MLTSDRGAGSTRALTSFIEEEVHLDHLLAPVYAAASGVEALRHLIDAGAQFEPQIHAMVQAALQMQDDPTVIALSRQRMRTRFAAMRVVIAGIEAEGRLSTGWDVETATAFLWSLTAPGENRKFRPPLTCWSSNTAGHHASGRSPPSSS